MKKAVLVAVCVAVALLIAIGDVLAQDKADIVGTWTGYTFVGDGSRLDFVFTVAEGEEGLTGMMSIDETGTIPEIPCRNVTFADNKLTCELDYPEGMELVLIRVTLTLEGDLLKGFWTNPEGESDIVELARKK